MESLSILFFFKNKKDAEKYFHAGVILSNRKKRGERIKPEADFINRICCHSYILSAVCHQIIRETFSVHVKIYRQLV